MFVWLDIANLVPLASPLRMLVKAKSFEVSSKGSVKFSSHSKNMMRLGGSWVGGQARSKASRNATFGKWRAYLLWVV